MPTHNRAIGTTTDGIRLTTFVAAGTVFAAACLVVQFLPARERPRSEPGERANLDDFSRHSR